MTNQFIKVMRIWLIVASCLFIVSVIKGAYCDDIEIDSLTERFSNTFRTVSEKLGQQQAPGNIQAEEASQKMKQLYTNLEQVMTEARQRAANARSILISSEIDTLRLA